MEETESNEKAEFIEKENEDAKSCFNRKSRSYSWNLNSWRMWSGRNTVDFTPERETEHADDMQIHKNVPYWNSHEDRHM
jgi:hypothetical protein